MCFMHFKKKKKKRAPLSTQNLELNPPIFILSLFCKFDVVLPRGMDFDLSLLLMLLVFCLDCKLLESIYACKDLHDFIGFTYSLNEY